MKKFFLTLLFLLSGLIFTVNAVRQGVYPSRLFILGFEQGLNGNAVQGVSAHKTPRLLDVGKGNCAGLQFKKEHPKIAQELLQSCAGQEKTFEENFKAMIDAGTLKFSQAQ